jgi:hypothetical protein
MALLVLGRIRTAVNGRPVVAATRRCRWALGRDAAWALVSARGEGPLSLSSHLRWLEGDANHINGGRGSR